MAQTNSVTPAPWMITLPEVVRLTTISRANIYRMVKAGEFPAQVSLSASRVAWRYADVAAWLESRQPSAVKVH